MRVRLATSAEIDARSRMTALAWGNKLTLEQYLAREHELAATAFAKNGLRTWVLEDDAGAIVASCETYRMTSVLDGTRGVTHGLASVFVEPSLRRRGFAREMLSRVIERLRGEGAQAAHLFSEVGTSLYGSLGFVARPIAARRWSAIDASVAEVALPFGLAGRDALASRLLSGAGRFRIVLDDAQLEWHRARARAYHRVLAPERLAPDSLLGAIAGDAWIAWFPDYRLDKLLTLAIGPGTPAETGALVEAARRAAHALGFAALEHWECPATILPGGEQCPLPDEIPMILPFAAFAPGDWVEYGRGCWV